MTSFVNVCDVKSAEKRYAGLKMVYNKTKMNMTCASSHGCLGSPVVRKKEFRLNGFISLVEINLSMQIQNYRFYLFDKSWYFPAKHVIYCYTLILKIYILKAEDIRNSFTHVPELISCRRTIERS